MNLRYTVVVALVLCGVGCRPTFRAKSPGVGELQPKSFKLTRVFDQPGRPTTILITVTSSNGPVDVFVFKTGLTTEDQEREGKRVLETGQPPADLMAVQQDVTQGTLEVPIDAGNLIGGILVANRGAAATTVTLGLAEKAPN
jgi:hypothetical protein